MKKAFIILVLIIFLTACQSQSIKKTEIKIRDKVITAEVMDTLPQQIKGLSGKKSLGKDDGMLFVYNDKEIRTFWMKDMLFPIDIIWIADDEIVDFSENVPIPIGEEIPRVRPKESVNYVLEVNAGFVAENGLEIGDEVIKFIKS